MKPRIISRLTFLHRSILGGIGFLPFSSLLSAQQSKENPDLRLRVIPRLQQGLGRLFDQSVGWFTDALDEVQQAKDRRQLQRAGATGGFDRIDLRLRRGVGIL